MSRKFSMLENIKYRETWTIIENIKEISKIYENRKYGKLPEMTKWQDFLEIEKL